MTTLRNPVEPFGPTPVQVAKDPSNPPTGGTGVFGKTAAAIGRMGRKAVGTTADPRQASLDALAAYQLHDDPLPLQYWVPEAYDTWWVDQERKRLGLPPTAPLPEGTIPEVAEDAESGKSPTTGGGGNLGKRYNTQSGGTGKGGIGLSLSLGSLMDDVPEEVKWAGAAMAANALLPGAGMALSLGRRVAKLFGVEGEDGGGGIFNGRKDLPSNEGAMSLAAFNSLSQDDLRFGGDGTPTRNLRSSNVGIGRTPDGITSAQHRAMTNTSSGASDKNRRRGNKNNPGGGGDSKAGGGINSGGGNPRSSADISPGRGG